MTRRTTAASTRPDPPRWIEVDGRRWRATDPSIPEVFRKELVDELMDARRAIGKLGSDGDSGQVAGERARVQAAKVALGERGEPWWVEGTDDGWRQRVEAAILALAGHRSPDRTICPSDAARAVGGDSWRSITTLARDVARDLARSGRVEVTQKGEPLDPEAEWKGPIRIRLLPPG